MRISTLGQHQTGLNAILNQQAKINKTQQQLATGKKNSTPSDDPLAAARLVDLKQTLEQTKQYQDNIDTAKQRLSLEEAGLQNALNVAQRVKEAGIQGVNGSNSPEAQKIIAEELDDLNDQLLSIANTKNSNGEYLFSGYLSKTEPFTKTAGTPNTFAYNGDANQRSIQVGPTRKITDGDPGEAVFGTSGGDSIFEAIEALSQSLKNGNPQFSLLDDIGAGLEKIAEVEASVGTRRLGLDRQEEFNSDFILNTEGVISETEDLDFASAISQFNLQTVALQAAQQSFAKVQNLSLFNFL